MIDFCVSFNAANSKVLSGVLFNTLRIHCDLSDIQFHIVNNAVINGEPEAPTGALRYNLNIAGWRPTELIPTHTDTYGWMARSVLTPWDVTEYMVESCGSCEWCIVSHFDLIIKGDVLGFLRDGMQDKVALVGGFQGRPHCPIMAVRRSAYKGRRVGFGPGIGYDVGGAFCMDMGSQGWECRYFPPEPYSDAYFYHMGGGGGYHNRREYESMRERAIALGGRP